MPYYAIPIEQMLRDPTLLSEEARGDAMAKMRVGSRYYTFSILPYPTQCGGRLVQIMPFAVSPVGREISTEPPSHYVTYHAYRFQASGIVSGTIECHNQDVPVMLKLIDSIKSFFGSDVVVEQTTRAGVSGTMIGFVIHDLDQDQHDYNPEDQEPDLECPECGEETSYEGWCDECNEYTHSPEDYHDDERYYPYEDDDLTGIRSKDYANVLDEDDLRNMAEVYCHKERRVLHSLCWDYDDWHGEGYDMLLTEVMRSRLEDIRTNRVMFVSSNVGEPEEETLHLMRVLLEQADWIERIYNVKVVFPKGYATNPNMNYHYIDSCMLVAQPQVQRELPL